jgi:hypothetical protein
MSTDKTATTEADDPPPFLGRWRNVYLVVAAELAVIVALFAALTWWAS